MVRVPSGAGSVLCVCHVFTFLSLRRMRLAKVTHFSPNLGNSAKILQKLYKDTNQFCHHIAEIVFNVEEIDCNDTENRLQRHKESTATTQRIDCNDIENRL